MINAPESERLRTAICDGEENYTIVPLLDLELSKKTVAALIEIGALTDDARKIDPAIADILASDKLSVDEAAAKLGTLQARRDVLEARRNRRRVSVIDALHGDIVKMVEPAKQAADEAQQRVYDAKAAFKSLLAQELKKDDIRTIDAGFVPLSVKTAQNTLYPVRDRWLCLTTLSSVTDTGKGDPEPIADYYIGTPPPRRTGPERACQDCGLLWPELA